MSSTIQTRVISAANDNVISMSNSTWARGVALPSNWQKVRFGIRFMLSPLVTLTAGTSFYMGFCSGTTNMIGDAVTTNFVGAGFTTTVAESPPGNNQLANVWSVATKVGTTLTVGSTILSSFLPQAANTTALQEMLFVDVIKGSPNYTIKMFGPNQNGPIGVAGSSDFFTQVVADPPSYSDHGYTGGVTIAASEAAGAFNAVTCWWSNTVVLLEINDMAVVLLA